MRIMAHGAFHVRIMLFRVNPSDIDPSACGVHKAGMTSQAEPPAPIYREFRGIGRMLNCRTMAVFTLYDCMRCTHYAFILVRMALIAVISPLIFDRYLFPVLYISFPVPAIHVTAFMYAKILWNIKESDNKDYADKTQN